MRLSLMAAALILTAGCGTGTGESGDSSADGPSVAGIRGVVLVGPVCPVQVAERPCVDRPLKAVVHVTGSGPHGVAQVVTTGSDGRFSFTLEPGNYVLTAQPQAWLPTARVDRRTVTVHRGAFSTLTLRFDSGIR